MKAFAQLYTTLDETTATNEKVAALVEFFRTAPAEDAAWAVHFLTGRRPKRLVSSPDLRMWAAAEAGEESAEGDEAAAVGDGEDAVGGVGVGVPAQELVCAGVDGGDVVSGGAGAGVVGLTAGAGDVEVASHVEDAFAERAGGGVAVVLLGEA